MPSYVVLINWSQQGITNFGHTLEGYRESQQALGNASVTFKDIYWTIGQHDLVAIVQAPDDETAAAAMLAISSPGGIRTNVLRAFDENEIEAVLAKASSMAAALAADGAR
jgi:uncharacterized protein with GYD domain